MARSDDPSTSTLLNPDQDQDKQPIDHAYSYSPKEPEPETTTHISNHRSQIALNWAIITIPITLLTAVLLGLVFRYRVHHTEAPFDHLRVGGTEDDEKGVYYVDLNSSVILFIASWASSLAPLLSGFIITLALFPIARGLLRDARAGAGGGRSSRLLTPYQLALMLRLINGSVLCGIWSWILYLFTWRAKRAKQAPALIAAVTVALFGTLLGFLVFLADTWLHLTTTTVEFTQVSPVNSGIDYGFGLSPRCFYSDNSVFGAKQDVNESHTCALSVAVTGSFLIDPSVSLQVMNNISDSIMVRTYYGGGEGGTPYTYLGIPPHSPSLAKRDYTATTYGAQTQCELISNKCHLHNEAAIPVFNCSSAFADQLLDTSWHMAFFTDASMNSSLTEPGVGNPFYFAMATVVNPSGGTVPNSSEIITTLHGGSAFVLGCHSTIYDVEYNSVNGTVTGFQTTPSNTSVSNIWQSVMANTVVGVPILQQATTLATFSKTGQEFADKIALAYSRVSLAVGADAVVPRPALAAQERSTSFVARVPAAPLFSLVTFNLLYVLVGFVFAGVALVASSKEKEVPDVQARLSVEGLVADRFEDPRAKMGVENVEDLFEERDGRGSRRVAIDQTDTGGYEFKTWPVERSTN